MSYALSRVIIFVEDMRLMHKFYHRLILGRDVPLAPFNEHWMEINGPGVSIALHGGGKSTTAAKAQDIKLCFHATSSDDLDELMERMGLIAISERSPAENILVKDFTDPEGNEFSVEIY